MLRLVKEAKALPGQNYGGLATPQAHTPKIKGSKADYGGGQGVKADYSGGQGVKVDNWLVKPGL